MSAPVVDYAAICRICGKEARAVSLNIPIIGHPGERAMKLLAVLSKHLTLHHPKAMQAGTALAQEFQAWCILNAFTFQDPSIMPRLELTRASVFASVRKNTIQDSALEKIVAGFALDPEDAEKVNAAMKAVRDACCELGPYAPKVPEQAAQIVTPV
jgi:hypothetical protein